ncbi:hypothetical protein FRC17_008202, partial [Serendipita sp. 399]
LEDMSITGRSFSDDLDVVEDSDVRLTRRGVLKDFFLIKVLFERRTEDGARSSVAIDGAKDDDGSGLECAKMRE